MNRLLWLWDTLRGQDRLCAGPANKYNRCPWYVERGERLCAAHKNYPNAGTPKWADTKQRKGMK